MTVRGLRDQGMSLAAIARETGLSVSKVRRILSPEYAERMRQLSREAKRRRTGTCEKCGTETRYNGHAHVTSRLCLPCAAAASGLARRGHGPRPRQVVDLLERQPTATYTEICRHLGVVGPHAANVLNRMVRFGLIERVSRGVYRLPQHADRSGPKTRRSHRKETTGWSPPAA